MRAAPRGEAIDVIVLACTHFPLLADEIAVAWPGPALVDGGAGIARRIAHLTAGQAWPDQAPPGIAVFTSPAPVGLRSAEDARSIVDLFGLNLAPHQPTSSRFTIVGDDMLATRALADGSTQSLLPGDLSLLRIDDYLVIDFSDRPFDELELGRMVAVLDQLAAIA